MGVCQTDPPSKYYKTSHGYGGSALGQHRPCWPYGILSVLAGSSLTVMRTSQGVPGGPPTARLV